MAKPQPKYIVGDSGGHRVKGLAHLLADDDALLGQIYTGDIHIIDDRYVLWGWKQKRIMKITSAR